MRTNFLSSRAFDDTPIRTAPRIPLGKCSFVQTDCVLLIWIFIADWLILSNINIRKLSVFGPWFFFYFFNKMWQVTPPVTDAAPTRIDCKWDVNDSSADSVPAVRRAQVTGSNPGAGRMFFILISINCAGHGGVASNGCPAGRRAAREQTDRGDSIPLRPGNIINIVVFNLAKTFLFDWRYRIPVVDLPYLAKCPLEWRHCDVLLIVHKCVYSKKI